MTIELTKEQRDELYGYAWNLLGDGMGNDWEVNPGHTEGVIQMLNEILGGDYDDKERLPGHIREFGRRDQLRTLAYELQELWVHNSRTAGPRIGALIDWLVKFAEDES